MKQSLVHISLLVHQYDEAIDFYVNKLRFTLVENTKMTEDKSWVLVRPRGEGNCSLLLAKAVGEQSQYVGNQSGGRVFLFLQTDDFERDYKNLLDHHITILRKPSEEPYGKVCVFADLYGNKWDLIQRKI
jgi:catechol 2,3-dioxygenase-like lactoylglutathione lyase family enzyme